MDKKILQFKRKEEPVIDADYFGSEKIPVSDLLSLLNLVKELDEKLEDKNEKRT